MATTATEIAKKETNGTRDSTRTYLKEIGRVPLGRLVAGRMICGSSHGSGPIMKFNMCPENRNMF
ncbi:sigma-70 factor domain-containing protein [Nocardia pseudovaccinii]|uniref:sigma-70 factor domain-containing protein n=1 Tax=Nocardia pseudovaccinii TaxID=189540 RepID=UPI0012F4AFE2